MSPAPTHSVFLMPSASHATKGEAVLARAGIHSALIPVPRTLSSQCGVCLRVSLSERPRAEESLAAAEVQVSAIHDLKMRPSRKETGVSTQPSSDRPHAHPGSAWSNPGSNPELNPGPTVVAISSDGMGRGDDDLGRVLIRSHLHALTEISPKPDVMIFFNTGVMLAVEGSPALEDLRALEGQGARILLCGTCVGHFNLKEKVAVGEISNMYTISETLLRAGKVINL